MGRRTGRFRRADRLLKSREFRRVGREGQRRRSRYFVVLATRRDLSAESCSPPRLGVTVGRRVGNAVARNHLKRRIREWFRRQRGGLERGTDLVVIARAGAAELKLVEISASLDQLAISRTGAVRP